MDSIFHSRYIINLLCFVKDYLQLTLVLMPVMVLMTFEREYKFLSDKGISFNFSICQLISVTTFSSLTP